jgi:hypothetical protein
VLKEVVVPKPAADLPELSVETIVGLTGNAARGKGDGRALPDVSRSAASGPSSDRHSTDGAVVSLLK